MSWTWTGSADPSTLDPLRCALFLISAFILAGAAQTWWFKSPRSARFALPLDGGRTLRGRRLLGANKTWKGFVVMVPAAMVAFALLATAARALPGLSEGLWPLTPLQYALLGGSAALGFMLGELPNSFMKRQLGIAPGSAPTSPWGRWLGFAVDRLDSIVGMLLALSLLVPVSWRVWLFVLAVGPAIHWLFNVALYALGVKARPA
ncbi:CDP-archaeol synthase [Hyalangium rubrum]|uniref:CDP-archaeol synthase n=1 Tax=Hyalangium rubrum TaxID=3103134 RepID=A0ABU5H179_9BACT|nr:CDP-archaeol synthase [Hyalangium sp. s54d21]MDY7227209.1 CDP-archaeol synthase [Hyalangium sp. s54d21]